MEEVPCPRCGAGSLEENLASRLNFRPKISVCIAAYQGERYIALQLRSILEQLSPDDEVIVVDDGSTDGTCREITAFHDPRINLIPNAGNLGVIRAFETALYRSTGEIVLLSDQDDLWLPNKVEAVLDAFAHDPDLVLVASDAILIDEDGEKIGDSFYAKRGKFRAGLWSNLLIGKFHGCTMAFRSTLLRSALPFPAGRLVHHDTWIGCMNALIGGKTRYIADPLVAYRRHSTNVTGRIKLSNYIRLKMRSQILLGLLAFWLTGWRKKVN
jgi:glycosyltransferase involved in cell wall biosynthesis